MPEKFPLVSVIVAVKNETVLLERCLNSILVQDYPNIEIIIVDDGSEEKTKNILSKYLRENIIIHFESISKGQSYCRNLALSLARGSYIAIADADDHFVKNRIKNQVAFLEKNAGVFIVGSDFFTEPTGKNWSIYFAHDKIKHQMLLNNPMVHSSVMLRAHLVASGFHYLSEFDSAEDYEVFARNRHDWRFANMPQKLVYYRINERSDATKEKQQMLARKIRETVLHDYLQNPSREDIKRHHLFSEVQPGLSIQEALKHITSITKSGLAKEARELNNILYTQLWLYAVKTNQKLSVFTRLKIVIFATYSWRQFARIIISYWY